MFRGMANRFLNYHGGGWDIGAAQWAAGHLDVDFLVLANSGVFFHRPGWLKRLIEARHAGGEGLYGAMASYEPSPYVPGQVNPHIRTSFYACNPRIFREYPHLIDSREKSLAFEAGEWNFLRWFESRGLPGFMVTWDGCYGKEEFRKPPNIFRKGDQSNLLVWDRYSEMYAHGDPQTRYVQEVFANAGLSLY
jgi:hypothetical protein